MLETVIRSRKRRQSLRVSLLCGLISGTVSALSTLRVLDPAIIGLNGLVGLFIGFMTPFSLQSLIGLAKSRLVAIRRVPRLLVMLLFAVTTMVVVTALTLATLLVISFIADGTLPFADIINYSLGYALISAAVLGVSISFYVTMQDFLGEHFFHDLFLGLYAAPVERAAAVAFVDLSGSTGLAESMSASQFFALLNEYLGLVETCAVYTGGSIYKYLGDGVIVVWNLPGAGRQPLDFMVCLDQEMAERQTAFRERFGTGIQCTAGLHAGRLLVGEIGRQRKELGYWGDTVNTAQRVQATCKRAATRLLVSEDYLSSLNNGSAPEGWVLQRLDRVFLPGKRAPITLYALDRLAKD